MILGIDASRCVKGGTGVEIYSVAIIRELLRSVGRQTHGRFDRVHLYTPRPIPGGLLVDGLTGSLTTAYPFVEEQVLTMPKLWTQVRLSAEMISEPPDVLFIPSHTLPMVHPRQSVVMIHDVAFMRVPAAYSRAQRWYLKFSTWLAVREAAKLIVPSQAVAEDLVKYFSCVREKIEVVHHGFEIGGLESGGREGSSEHELAILENFGVGSGVPYIFYVGRLEEKKNIVRLIEAFLKFHETHPTWKLILAGSRGFGFERIFEAVDRRDAWSHIVMPGYVTDEERAILYKHCRFTAFVSLAEGFGFPILESMSYGKDVLMSDLPVMREVVSSGMGAGKGTACGMFADPLNTDAITEKMRELADMKISADRSEALKYVPASYTWEKAAESTLRVLESVAK